MLALRGAGAEIIDVRPFVDYAAAHIPGSLAIELRPAFATWLGWLVPDPQTRWSSSAPRIKTPTKSSGRPARSATTTSSANSTAGIGLAARPGSQLASTALLSPEQCGASPAARHPAGRRVRERACARTPATSNSVHSPAPTSPPGPLVMMCGHGERAATGASVLERAGRRDLGVLLGGARRLGRRDRPPSRGQRLKHSPATSGPPAPARAPRFGLRANLAQFSLLVAVNALVGGTLGQERTVVPLLAAQTFHLSDYTAALTFIAAFGIVKAVTNFFAGTLSDRYGRKPVLVAGWLVAIPIPALLIWAPSWGWVIAANVLLGINQGLTWSTTVIMKIDLVGPARRGLAMGLNEAAGYGALAVTALATGYLAAAHGLRPAPFLLGAAYIALGPRAERDSPSGKPAATPATKRAPTSPPTPPCTST